MTAEVKGQVGDTVLVDPDGADKWLVLVEVPADGTPTVGDVQDGVLWTERAGGYVEPADEDAAAAALAAVEADPPVIPGTDESDRAAT